VSPLALRVPSPLPPFSGAAYPLTSVCLVFPVCGVLWACLQLDSCPHLPFPSGPFVFCFCLASHTPYPCAFLASSKGTAVPCALHSFGVLGQKTSSLCLVHGFPSCAEIRPKMRRAHTGANVCERVPDALPACFASPHPFTDHAWLGATTKNRAGLTGTGAFGSYGWWM
jgi:hypothetical protein